MTIDDLLTSQEPPTAEQMNNLNKLLVILQKFEDLYGKPLRVTSGIRTIADQARIYQQINDRRVIAGLPELATPMRSAHMSGDAVDLDDPDGALKVWILDHLEFFEDNGIYFEDFDYTDKPRGWTHLQQIPPKSGKRFFVP